MYNKYYISCLIKKQKLRSRKSSLICIQKFGNKSGVRTEFRSTLVPVWRSANVVHHHAPLLSRLEVRDVDRTASTGPSPTIARFADACFCAIDPMARPVLQLQAGVINALWHDHLAEPRRCFAAPPVSTTARTHLSPATLPLSLFGHDPSLWEGRLYVFVQDVNNKNMRGSNVPHSVIIKPALLAGF